MSDDIIDEDGVSIFRPSYSATWLNCSGSLIPSMKADDSAGYDAAVGTVFHELMREWQLNGRPDDWSGQIWDIEKLDKYGRVVEVFHVEIDEDMFVYGQECLEYVKDIPGKIYVETRVDISPITPIPGQGGTADRVACEPGILDITDWKYGKGVAVYAKKNTQLLQYAAGFFFEYDSEYDFRKIRMRIAQPRKQIWDMWEITREELLEWIDWMKGRAYRAWKRNAPRSPSPKACQWCKVQTDCAALEAVRQELADEMAEIYEDITEERMGEAGRELMAIEPGTAPTLPSPATLTTAHLVRIYPWRGLMESWFRRIGEELIARGSNGEDLELFKIVEGRTRRKYADEEAAAALYERLGLTEDDIFEFKLRSPNALKTKLRTIGIRGKLQDNLFRMLTIRPRGRPTLVPSVDARSEIPSLDDIIDEEDE